MKLFHSPTDWINHYVNRSQTQELDTKRYVQLREEDQKKSQTWSCGSRYFATLWTCLKRLRWSAQWNGDREERKSKRTCKTRKWVRALLSHLRMIGIWRRIVTLQRAFNGQYIDAPKASSSNAWKVGYLLVRHTLHAYMYFRATYITYGWSILFKRRKNYF